MNKNKLLQDYIFVAKYARNKGNRKETWEEAVDRVMAMHRKFLIGKLGDEVLVDSILDQVTPFYKEQRILGAQRALQWGGDHLLKKQFRMYNCSASYVDRPEFFGELMYILLSGAGVGMSVQKYHVAKLPEINSPGDQEPFIIPDSIEGWAEAVQQLMSAYFYGTALPIFDYSKIRPEGALVANEFKAPGPEPLRKALELLKDILDGAVGRKIRPMEAHDMSCILADAVISGAVRRSALISLFSIDDDEMMSCKTGDWFYKKPWLARSNNSAVILPDTPKEEYERIFKYVKEYGEPGFLFLDNEEIILNPCAEVGLYPILFDENGEKTGTGFGVCNLTEINAAKIKTEQDFYDAARAAAIMGTIQAMYTDFNFVSPYTKAIVERDALIGVGITGMAESYDIVFNPEYQRKAAEIVRKTNERFAEILGINPAARTTVVKPAGCRPKDGLVTCSDGIFTLEELLESHDVKNEWNDVEYTLNVIQGDKTNRINKTFRNGVDDVYEIRMQTGLVQKSTSNHKWFVKEKGFVETKNIKPGDILDIHLGVYNKKTNSKLKPSNHVKHKMDFTNRNLTFPEEVTADLSWLIGYLWGDGTMSNIGKRLRFIDQNKYNLDKVKIILKDLFNIKTIIKKSKDRDAYTIESGSIELWEWLIDNGIYKYATEDKKLNIIPKVIRESSKESIIAFFAGLIDADGCVHLPKNDHVKRLTLAQSYKKSITRHLQEIGMAVGLYFSHSFNTKGKNKQAIKDIVLMYLTSDSLEHSVKLLTNHSNKIQNTFPKYTLTSNKYLKARNHIIGKVKEIVYIGKEETFDVSIENDPWFYAGAVKSHNTSSLLLGTSSGIHPFHNYRYIRNVQANKNERALGIMEKVNPMMVQDGVWNKNDKVISFPVEKDAEEVMIAEDLIAIQFLELVKLTQNNWIANGTNLEHPSYQYVPKAVTHNVSNSCTIKPEEFDEVREYLWNNRQYFTGVSLIPSSGDLDYPQAPFVRVLDEVELSELYGPAAILAGGLNVDGIHAFGDLWLGYCTWKG